MTTTQEHSWLVAAIHDTTDHHSGNTAALPDTWTAALAAGRAALLTGTLDTLAISIDGERSTAPAATTPAGSTRPRSPQTSSRSTRASPPPRSRSN